VELAARLALPLPARFAALTHDLGKARTPAEVLPRHIGHEAVSADLLAPLCERLRVPAECRDVALLVARFHSEIHKVAELRPATLVKVLERCDALRRPARFEHVLGACEADARGRLGFGERPYAQAGRWRAALAVIQSIDGAAIARTCTEPAQIPARIHAARIAAVSEKLVLGEGPA
jgi:tRNA nucleotidyltransferase (CCA-adding enzyme)